MVMHYSLVQKQKAENHNQRNRDISILGGLLQCSSSDPCKVDDIRTRTALGAPLGSARLMLALQHGQIK